MNSHVEAMSLQNTHNSLIIPEMFFLCGAQLSPPNEHIIINNPWRPWWQRYQPISYNLCSRSGSEAELRDMITRCNNVGVNHISHSIQIIRNVAFMCLALQHKTTHS